MSVEKNDWQELCRAASQEHDSEHLIALVSELINALDGSEPEASGEKRPEPQG